MRQRRRRAHRGLRALAVALLLAAVLPLACVIGLGLAQGRDLAAAWRALRAPGPKAVAAPVALPAAPYGPPSHVGSLLDPELREVSGLVASRRSPPVLWAVNDGGNAHRLYALSLEGRRLRSFDIAVPEDGWFEGSDWEDLAGFRHEGTPYLLIADVGDNWSWRKSVRLWIVEEPDLAEPAVPLVPRWRIDLVYADGARDCEAVAVDETDLSLLLVSKRTAPPVVYAAELAPLLRTGGGEVVARPLARLGIPPPSTERADALAPAMLHMPTALDLAPDGSAALVLSYTTGWRFPRGAGESWAEAFARAPEQLALPPLALAEAVAYVGESLFVTSEVDRLALVRWRAPLVRFDPQAHRRRKLTRRGAS
jgi:hypothetical protein